MFFRHGVDRCYFPLPVVLRVPRAQSLFEFSFDANLGLDECVHPLVDILDGIMGRCQNRDIRAAFDLFNVGKPDFTVGRNEKPLLAITEPNDTWVLHPAFFVSLISAVREMCDE